MMLFNRKCFFTLALSLCVFSGLCQTSLYSAGYHEVKLIDSSRQYQTLAKPGDPLFYRPVQLDIWYPANKKTNQKPLDYFFFLSLFERRANSFQTDTKYTSLATELLKHFTIGNPKIAGHPTTQSMQDAKPARGSFPIIIYMCSFNGMSYENVPLFERLAQEGYYVISVSSIGRYPGNMTTKYQDVLEQTGDAVFVINHLNDQLANFTRIGVIGYSYGGLSGELLVKQYPKINSFLSLDGSERHYYGRDKKEDLDFDSCRTYGALNDKLNCVYAYLESDHKNTEGAPDSIFKPKVNGDCFYSRLANAEHEDFSCITGLGDNKTGIYNEVLKLSVAYFDETLKGKKGLLNPLFDSLVAKHKIFKTSESTPLSSTSITIAGKIIDQNTGAVVPYASIGIPSGNCGTVSNDKGQFILKIPDSLKNNNVRISSIGYQPLILSVNEILQKSAANGIIVLKQNIHELATVSIGASKPVYKIVGNTSRSKFFSVGFPLRDLGSELGIMVSFGKHKVLLQTFNYHISQTRMDSCTFRLNIYSVKNGVPAENLLSKNILSSIGRKAGDYAIDLKPYALEFSGQICISLEWIAGKTSADRGAVFFSGGLLASSYHRKTAQADWTKFKGLGAAFNLKVEKL